MRVTVEAINTDRTYKHGALPPVLRLYSTISWMSAEGQPFLQGSPNRNKDWYQSVQCEITGGDIIRIPTIEINSTEDAPHPFNETARYTGRLLTANNRQIAVWPPGLDDFVMPAVEDITWGSIIIHNQARKFYAAQMSTYLNAAEVYGIVLQEIANLKTNYLDSLRRDVGTATMDNGVITVANASVAADSSIKAWWISPDNMPYGSLSVPAASIIPGVSFSIVSTDALDSGVVGWEMLYV